MAETDAKTYLTRRVSSREEFDKICEGREGAEINILPWGGEYAPESGGILCPDYVSRGLWVGLFSTEKKENIRAEAAEFNGPVYEDSCLEFFFSPEPGSRGYINIENNSLGVMLFGVHNGELDGQVPGLCESDFAMRAQRRHLPGGAVLWEVRFFVDFGLISRFFPGFSPAPGTEIRGNFYKCGDKCPKAHYLAWSPIEFSNPSFHRPEFFGTIVL